MLIVEQNNIKMLAILALCNKMKNYLINCRRKEENIYYKTRPVYLSASSLVIRNKLGSTRYIFHRLNSVQMETVFKILWTNNLCTLILKKQWTMRQHYKGPLIVSRIAYWHIYWHAPVNFLCVWFCLNRL